MLDSVVAYVLVRAAAWDLQTAMRWLTGSLNSATWDQVVPVLVALRRRSGRCCSAGPAG